MRNGFGAAHAARYNGGMSKRHALLTSAFATVASLGVMIACGGTGDGSEFGASGGASGASGGTSGASGSSSFGGTSSSGEGGASSGDGGNCNAPVDMYIMFDKSGSMGNDCNVGATTNSKWCRGINALAGYFKSAGATGQSAALQFFPFDNHQDSQCGTGTGYDKPALPAADFTTLPSNSFEAILNSTDPDGETPTEAAIRGLTKFTAANRRPGKVTIGILITDGNPNGCNEDLGDLSNLLDAHFKATTVRTYVIGMQGADFAKIEQIAQGGGTPTHPDKVGTLNDACGNGTNPCKHWNVGDGDPAAFIAALAAIQESADGCKPGGGTVNPPK